MTNAMTGDPGGNNLSPARRRPYETMENQLTYGAMARVTSNTRSLLGVNGSISC